MKLHAVITDIASYLPDQVLTNEELSLLFEGWSPEKILAKTGIEERRISAKDELSSDMAVKAAEKLFEQGKCERDEIDYILLCTQSPDYFLPTTACIVQSRLGLPTTCGALDFNLGCSGYIYGLGLAKGLIETGQARSVILLTSETYTKFINEADKSTRTIFGDGATATLIQAKNQETESIGPFEYGSDGSGGQNLIVPTGGMRTPRTTESGQVIVDDSGNGRSQDNLYMNGGEIFNFTLQTVPEAVQRLTEKLPWSQSETDFYVFHQANAYMLKHIQKKCGIEDSKFPIRMKRCGNTVSSTIPLMLEEMQKSGEIKSGSKLIMVGFGVGYSWGACCVQWA